MKAALPALPAADRRKWADMINCLNVETDDEMDALLYVMQLHGRTQINVSPSTDGLPPHSLTNAASYEILKTVIQLGDPTRASS